MMNEGGIKRPKYSLQIDPPAHSRFEVRNSIKITPKLGAINNKTLNNSHTTKQSTSKRVLAANKK